MTLGFFAFVKKAGRSVISAVVKVGKAVVRAVKNVGKAVIAYGRRVARSVGKAIEDLGRAMQRKPPAELERICRLLEAQLRSVEEARRTQEVSDFAAWARVAVIEQLLPKLIDEVSQARAMHDVSADIRNLAEPGPALIDDPASVSDEALNAVENLCQFHLHGSVERVALEQFILLFEGERAEVKSEVSNLEDEALRLRRLVREEELWAKLEKAQAGRLEMLQQSLVRAESSQETRNARLQDLELMSWTCEGLLQAEADETVRSRFPEQISIIEQIVFEFFRAGPSAVLDEEQRNVLRATAHIFSGDAIRRIEKFESQDVEVTT